MHYRLSQRSLNNLVGVHPSLVRVVKRAITLTAIDFMVTEGVRTPERQRQLYAQGRTAPGPKVTWTLNSNHFINAKTGFGHAVDLAPWPVDWSDEEKFAVIAKAMFEAARLEGVPIEWGGFWQNIDRPHFQLR